MLAANTVLKELDVSDNRGSGAYDGPGFAQELSAGIRDNGAISSLNLAKNSLSKDGALAICDALLGSSRYTNSIQLTTN
jgi:hypothetical protein